MDVREKLVELFYDNNMICDQKIEGLADDVMDIIAHGATVHEWISVKDRLPEPWKQVLIYSRHDFCESALYTGATGKWRVTWNHEMLDADSVNYWMPLPEPPKGE